MVTGSGNSRRVCALILLEIKGHREAIGDVDIGAQYHPGSGKPRARRQKRPELHSQSIHLCGESPSPMLYFVLCIHNNIANYVVGYTYSVCFNLLHSELSIIYVGTL